MPPRPSQKRPAGSVSEASSSQTAPSASKKTRFVEPEDDPANFAEQVDSNLENPSAIRKGRVKNEGYESDSSDDGETVVFSRRKGEGDKGEGEEDDMFAMGDKEKKDEDEDAGKKKEEYLRLGDIEGQEFGGGNSGSEDESSDEGEPEDEDDAERRKKAGMGYELSSFNMREEMEEGKFAADGTYLRTFDPHGVHDKWMEGIDEREIKLARRRKRQQEKLQKERQRAEERELAESGGIPSYEKQLLAMLKKGETVLEALQRLGSRAKRTQPAKRKPKTPVNSGSMAVDKAPKEPSDIDRITHLASSIMSLGDTDVYSKTYEELVRAVRSSGAVDTSWVPPSADVKYEYKWDVPGASGGEAFGPFSEDEMRAWFKASYFGVGGEKVQVRPVGGEWGSWDDVLS